MHSAYLIKYVVRGIINIRGDDMGKTSSAVKNRYNNKAYDRITIMPKKGSKDRYKAHAERRGKSLTALIIDLLEQDIQSMKNENGE